MITIKDRLVIWLGGEIFKRPKRYGLMDLREVEKDYIKLSNEELNLIYNVLGYAIPVLHKQGKEVREHFFSANRKITRTLDKRGAKIDKKRLNIEDIDDINDSLDERLKFIAIDLYYLDKRFAVYQDTYIYDKKVKRFAVLEYTDDKEEKIKIADFNNKSYRILNDDYRSDPRFEKAIKIIESYFYGCRLRKEHYV